MRWKAFFQKHALQEAIPLIQLLGANVTVTRTLAGRRTDVPALKIYFSATLR
jgi:hypothetical protein